MKTYKYTATSQDFKAIEEGIKTTYNQKLSFIFKDKKNIDDTLVISFDSINIYLWTKKIVKNLTKNSCNLSGFYSYMLPHKLSFEDQERLGWQARLTRNDIRNLLPFSLQKSDFEIPIIFGSLYGDLINTQKKLRGTEDNPYLTYESYLATIVHEFGHIYANQQRFWFFSNKKYNIKLMEKAQSSYLSSIKQRNISILLPSHFFLSEVFAFCTEYSASLIFWKNHKKNIDNKNARLLKILIAREKEINLDTQDSALNQNEPHNIALIIGPLIIAENGKKWPSHILKHIQL